MSTSEPANEISVLRVELDHADEKTTAAGNSTEGQNRMRHSHLFGPVREQLTRYLDRLAGGLDRFDCSS